MQIQIWARYKVITVIDRGVEGRFNGQIGNIKGEVRSNWSYLRMKRRHLDQILAEVSP